ncbi:MAG: peptide deformylase [Oscillospiraceae bacterium]|nr:peptide deformylase [Oscillospiraceae bacterium]
MALRNVFNYPDEMLNKKSREVTAFDDRLWVLLDDMHETLTHHEGVGIAAVQLGILRRVIVIDLDEGDGAIELINPEIVQVKGNQREMEGCLSCPGLWGYVERPEYVKIKYMNRHGKEQFQEATELLAIVFCHEIDHLNGVMFPDIADEMVDEDQAEAELEKNPKRRKKMRKRKKKMRR